MKADLGILLLLLGFTLAYLVLAGKLPTSTPTPASGTPQSPLGSINGGGLSNAPGATNINIVKQTGSGPGGPTPLGLPTMGYFHDLVASQGGMQ